MLLSQHLLTKRMDVLEPGKAIEDGLKLFREGFGRIFDFARVKCSNSTDFEAGANLSGKAALRATEDDVEKLLRRGHRRDVLPRRLHGGGQALCHFSPVEYMNCRNVRWC